MGSVTSLEFVNRIRRRMRAGNDVSNVTDEESRVLLDIVNAAISDVLASRNWDFDLRHDGVLNTVATQSITDVSTLSGNFSTTVLDEFDYAAFAAASSHVVRAIITSDSNYSNTAFRISNILDIGGQNALYLDGSFPGTVSTEATMKTVAHEYILPSTVRAVSTVTYEEIPLTLDNIDPTSTFETLIPRPHDITGVPEVVSIGGYDVATYPLLDGVGDPGLRMIVWPLPDDIISLKYSYYVEHARLSSATDSLTSVPDNVIEDIVRIAHGDAVASVGMDAEEGLRITASGLRSSKAKYANQSSQPRARNTLGSWSRKPGTRNTIDGFQGSTITK